MSVLLAILAGILGLVGLLNLIAGFDERSTVEFGFALSCIIGAAVLGALSQILNRLDQAQKDNRIFFEAIYKWSREHPGKAKQEAETDEHAAEWVEEIRKKVM